jgi:hypothetical protein
VEAIDVRSEESTLFVTVRYQVRSTGQFQTAQFEK